MIFTAAIVGLCFVLTAVRADESRPSVLEITETSKQVFDVTWRRPARGEQVLRLKPAFPAHCKEVVEPVGYNRGDVAIERWQLDCRPDGLEGYAVSIEGLKQTISDTLVRITLLNGVSHNDLLSGRQPSLVVDHSPSKFSVTIDYFVLGVVHILGGVDHLLFVLCLLMLVSGPLKLIKTITAFTVAHSITLAASSLGMVKVPQAPVEAVIALSIVFLARELMFREQSDSNNYQPGLSERAPWLVAFTFGLLHGFGFAGALAEIGLPQNEIPLALLMFNIGVEAGQLLFVGAVLLVMFGVKLSRWIAPTWATPAVLYGIGGISAFWLIDRFSRISV
jgi:hydrogenase/urease accessory protein HupE